jgi:hypothetical protein
MNLLQQLDKLGITPPGLHGAQFPLCVTCFLFHLQQQTLICDVSAFVTRLAAALDPGHAASRQENGTAAASTTAPGSSQAAGSGDRHSCVPPLILVDGYHALGAVPTDLRQALSCEPIASGRWGQERCTQAPHKLCFA